VANGNGTGLVLDIRGIEPDARRALIYAVVDKLIELDQDREFLIVTDHEPAGLGYQLDLRKETRGRYEYDYHQRADDAYVALMRRKRIVPERD